MTVENPACRSCGGAALEVFLDLGNTPLADRLVSEAMRSEAEPMYPLEVAFCRDCAMVQIRGSPLGPAG